MYGSLFHRYDHASKGSDTARGTLTESRGLAEILFRIGGKEKGIGAVIGRTVSLFRDKVEQAIELVTPANTLPENVKWDGTGGVLKSIADLVNNLNSTDNSQILISKEVDKFIKGFAFSIPFIFSSNSAYGASSFGANHTSFVGQEHSVFQAKQEQALKMVRGGDYTIMSGLQEFAILDNVTGNTIFASDVGKTPKEGEKFLRDIIAGKSVANAVNSEKGNKGEIIDAKFLTNFPESDKIRVNVKFNPLKIMGNRKGELPLKGVEAPKTNWFDMEASKTMASTNNRVDEVLSGKTPRQFREDAVGMTERYEANKSRALNIISSGNYYIVRNTSGEIGIMDKSTKDTFYPGDLSSDKKQGQKYLELYIPSGATIIDEASVKNQSYSSSSQDREPQNLSNDVVSLTPKQSIAVSMMRSGDYIIISKVYLDKISDPVEAQRFFGETGIFNPKNGQFISSKEVGKTQVEGEQFLYEQLQKYPSNLIDTNSIVAKVKKAVREEQNSQIDSDKRGTPSLSGSVKLTEGTRLFYGGGITNPNAKVSLFDGRKDLLLDLSGGMQASAGKMAMTLKAVFAKVIKMYENEDGKAQNSSIVLSLDISPEKLRAIGVVSFDVGDDGRIRFGLSQLRSAVNEVGKSIDMATTSGVVSYEHYIALGDFIKALHATGKYSVTSDRYGVDVKDVIENTATHYKLFEEKTNLIGGNVYSLQVGPKGTFGDDRYTWKVGVGPELITYPGQKTGTLKNEVNPSASLETAIIFGNNNNYKIYDEAFYSNKRVGGKVGFQYRDGDFYAGPEVGYNKTEGFNVMFRAGWTWGGKPSNGGHIVEDTSKGRPEMTAQSEAYSNSAVQALEQVDHVYKKEVERTLKLSIDKGTLPAGSEVLSNGDIMLSSGVTDLNGNISVNIASMASHFSAVLDYNGTTDFVKLSNPQTLSVPNVYKISAEQAGGTFVLLEVTATKGSVKIETNIRRISGVSLANKNAYMNGTKTFDQIAAIDVTAPTTPTLSITDSDSTGGTAESGYTNSRNVNLSITDSDNVGVTGRYVSESSTAPGVSDGGWSSTKPTSFTLSDSDGTKTVYVWTKDAEGNMSSVGSSTIKLDRVTPSGNSFVGTTPNAKTTQYNNLVINLGEDLTNGTITSVTSSNGGTLSGISINGSGNVQFNWLTPGVGGSVLTFAGRDAAGNTFSITKNVTLPN